MAWCVHARTNSPDDKNFILLKVLITLKNLLLQLDSLLAFLPLALFVYTYRTTHEWKSAFIYAGALSLVYLASLFITQKRIDAFILTIQCFLIGGAVMYLGDITWLKIFYGQCIEATLFLWFFVIGLFTTFFSQHGFIEIKSTNTQEIHRYSLYMLGGTLVACLVSWQFRGNFFIAGWILYVLLLFTRDLLITLHEQSQEKINRAIITNLSLITLSLALKKLVQRFGVFSLIIMIIVRKILSQSTETKA